MAWRGGLLLAEHIAAWIEGPPHEADAAVRGLFRDDQVVLELGAGAAGPSGLC